MLFIITIPSKIIKLLVANISPHEIAAGVCMGMFLGFIPLNGPMAVVLIICFFIFKINRLSAMLTLPIFKLFYILGVSNLADGLGGVLLINAEFLTAFWKIITGLPLIAYLDLNNTLITGGLAISALLSAPLYLLSLKGVLLMREKYAERLKNSPFVKWFRKIPLVNKLTRLITRLKGSA